MKRVVFVLVIALASAALTYFLVSRQNSQPPTASAGDLSWIQTEFELSAEQFAAVQQLHEQYSGQCARHCADIIAARRALAALPADASVGVRAAASARVTELEAVCNDATRAHLHRVASAMPPTQGERFLRTVEPHLAQLPHDGARGLSR